MSEEHFHDCVDYAGPTKEELMTIGAPQEETTKAHIDTQTVTLTVDGGCQTVYSTYPVVLDNAGQLLKQLNWINTAVTSALDRMRTSRNHMEVRREIELLTEQVRKFLTFHRNKLSEYTAAVIEDGSRSIIKSQLRDRSNAIIMPVLESLDSLRRHNLELDARFELGSYRSKIEQIADQHQSFRDLKVLTPLQHLI